MWRLILTFLKLALSFYISIWTSYAQAPNSFKLYFNILNLLRGCSVRIQICSMRIQNTPGATSAWILLVNSRRGESYWLIPSLAHFCCCVVTSWRRQVLLYAHSKCIGSCSTSIQNMAGAALFHHVGAQSNTTGLRDVNRAAPDIFWMRIEQISSCCE